MSAIFFHHIQGHQKGVGMRVSRQSLSRKVFCMKMKDYTIELQKLVLKICNFLCRLKNIKQTKDLWSAIFFLYILGHQEGVSMRVSRQDLSRTTFSHCKYVFKRPGYTCVALDTLMSPWIHVCRPGYT